MKALYTSPPGRPVRSGTNSTYLGSVLATQKLRVTAIHSHFHRCLYKGNNLFSWVNWGVVERTKMLKLWNGRKGGFEPGLSRLRVKHSTAELPCSTAGYMSSRVLVGLCASLLMVRTAAQLRKKIFSFLQIKLQNDTKSQCYHNLNLTWNVLVHFLEMKNCKCYAVHSVLVVRALVKSKESLPDRQTNKQTRTKLFTKGLWQNNTSFNLQTVKYAQRAKFYTHVMSTKINIKPSNKQGFNVSNNTSNREFH